MRTLLFLIILFTSSISLGAGIAQNCTSCHGKNGISNSENIPNLKGQKYNYLVKQLNDYKSGERVDATKAMNYLAKALTKKNIMELARYFNQIK